MQEARRLRVLQVGKYYPPHMGGIETHLHTLSAGLRESLELEVVVANDSTSTEIGVVDGVSVTRLGTPFHLASAPVCPTLVRKIRESVADVVHLHLPNPGAVLAYLASGRRGPLVASYHSDVIRQRALGRAFEPIQRLFLRRATAIVAATPDYIRGSATLTEFESRCRVIPYGIPLEPFTQADAAAVSRIQKEHGPRLVLGVGRLVYYKGFEFLVRAMESVQGKLLLIGEGPLRETLERVARKSGVADRVVFLGHVADLVPYYHAADAFVLPSIARSEAFGIVQLEAMASGTPVVNTSIDSGVTFVSRHEETGLTVPPADPRSLAAGLNRLLGDVQLRESLGRNARERAHREFGMKTMSERMLSLYYEIAR